MLIAISACGATRPAADPPVEDSPTPPTRVLLTTPEPLPRATVVDLVDGDTLVLSLDGSEVAVRLLAIDAPDPALGECFATAASAFVAAVAPPGAVLDLERDPSEADPSGHLPSYVFLPDGSMLNEQLVRGGFTRVAPDAAEQKYFERLQDAEDQARRDGLGLWGECNGDATPTPQAVVAGPPSTTPEATPAAAARDRAALAFDLAAEARFRFDRGEQFEAVKAIAAKDR